MNLHKQLLLKNDCYKTGATIVPKGVMVHSTGANNPNLRRYVQPNDGKLGLNNNNNHWNRSGVSVCVHAFIGKLADGSVATYQTLPWNYRGWHAGAGKNGSANNTHISFEICEDGLSDPDYFSKVYKEAVELTAMLCKTYKLNPLADGVVICHSEGCKRGVASNHADVMHWFPKHGKNMDDFRRDVAQLVNQSTFPAVPVDYNVTVVTPSSGLNCRTAPDATAKVIKVYQHGSTLHITKETYGWGYTGDGWVYLQYTQKVTKPIENMEKEIENMTVNEVLSELTNISKTGEEHSDWAEKATEWAKDEGLFVGDGNGNYGWKKPITREQLVLVLYKLQHK